MISAAAQFELSMIVALGVCDALTAATGVQFKVKWPNDIYAGDRKVCGILIENSIEGSRIGRSIAGIGINVNQLKFISDAPNPVSLAMLTGRTFDLTKLLSDVCRTILARMSHYESDPCAAGLVHEYRGRLWRGSGFYVWHDAASDSDFEAEIADVATDGMLTLRCPSGQLRRYAFKEVAAVL